MGWWSNVKDYYSGGQNAKAYAAENRQIEAQAAADESLRNLQKSFSDNSGRDPSPSVGYHPNNQRMTVYPEGGGQVLYCQYDPTEFTEKYTAEWHKTEIVGSAITPIQFKFIRPREWSMKLLLNDLGSDSVARSPKVESVDTGLAILRSWFLPSGIAGASSIGQDRPPTLRVILINEVFVCCLTDMTVVRKAIHPTNRSTTRAEVSVVFTEFTPGNIAL